MPEATSSNGIHHTKQRSSFARESMTNSSPAASVFHSDIFGSSSTSNGHGHTARFGSFSNPGRPLDRSNGMSTASSASFSDETLLTNSEARQAPAILIRRLSRHTTDEALKSMLIFATDLIDTQFVKLSGPEESGYLAAVARFRSQSSAVDAQQKLDGKPNTTGRAALIVEVRSSGNEWVGGVGNSWDHRRSTIDMSSSRAPNSATSSSSGSFSGPGNRSRFNSTFQSNDAHASSIQTSNGNVEFHNSDASAHFQSLFSPLTNSFDDGARVTGKSMINNDVVDDETGELLKDPVAYARNGLQARRSTLPQPQLPIARFGNLSLTTNLSGSNGAAMAAIPPSRGGNAMQPQISPTSLNGGGIYNSHSSNHYNHPQYPPVNPADQNPPCNTLYVGNLPVDASEDELKTLFSQQKGYKRMCFRTKQNGPMCFVEFDDVGYASKALKSLYGHPLHNSARGGIRLSFSKNPLGVRSSQNGNVATAQQGPSSYGNFLSSSNFSSVSGPPPGISAPAVVTNTRVASAVGSNSNYNVGSNYNYSHGFHNGVGAGAQDLVSNGYRAPVNFNGIFTNPFDARVPDFSSGAHRGHPALGVQVSGNYGDPGQSEVREGADYR